MGNPTQWQVLQALEQYVEASGKVELVHQFPRPPEGVRYDPRLVFHPNAVSPYLEYWLGKSQTKYARATLESEEIQDSWIGGLNIGGKTWGTSLSWLRPDGLKIVCTEKGMSYEDFLRLVKLRVNMTKAIQVQDVGKRLGRIFSPHLEFMKHGRVTDVAIHGPDIYVTFRLDGYHQDFVHLIREADGRWPEDGVSGIHWWDDRFTSLMFKRHVGEGFAFRVSGVEPEPIGVTKGHAVTKRLASDKRGRPVVHMISYDHKPTVCSIGDTVMIGVQVQVHGGDARTDIQTTINMGLDKVMVTDHKDGKEVGYYNYLAGNRMDWVQDVLEDPARLEPELNKSHRVDPTTLEFVPGVSEWSLELGHRYGLMSKIRKDGRRVAIPFLDWKWAQTQLESGKHMRIPGFRFEHGEDDATARYLCPDPTCFDEWGYCDPSKGVLQGMECYSGRVGEQIVVRNPMGDPTSFSIFNGVMRERLIELDRGTLFFLNPATIADKVVQKQQGTWDNDDRIKILYHPRVLAWVKAWNIRFQYPDPVHIVKPSPVSTRPRKPVPILYQEELVTKALEDRRKNQTSVGTVVNYEMLDTSVSTQKDDEWIPDLRDQIMATKDDAWRAFLESKIIALKDFPMFQGADVGRAVGDVVDSINKGGGGILDWIREKIFGANIQDPNRKPTLSETIPCLPEYWRTSSKRGDGDRSDRALRRRTDLVIVKSHMDKVRDAIELDMKSVLYINLREAVAERAFVPEKEFSTFPTHPAAYAVAVGLDARRKRRFQMLKRHMVLTQSDINPSLPCTCPLTGTETSCASRAIPGLEDTIKVKKGLEHQAAFVRNQREMAEYVDGKYETKDGVSVKIRPGHPIGEDVWVRYVQYIYKRAASNAAPILDKAPEDDSIPLEYRAYPDNILWGNDTGRLTVEAFKRVGLAREAVPIEWRVDDRRFRDDYKLYVGKVNVRDVEVYLPGTNVHIGHIALEPGQYDCSCGRIWVPIPEGAPLVGGPVTIKVFHPGFTPQTPDFVTMAWRGLSGSKVRLEERPTKADPSKRVVVMVLGGLVQAEVVAADLPEFYRQAGPDKTVSGYLELFYDSSDKLITQIMQVIPEVIR